MYNPYGFNLCQLSDNVWSLQVINGKCVIGTFTEVVVTSVYRFGFSVAEIEKGVEAMIELNHNTAHFGLYKKFIFSHNEQDKTRQAC
jgi:hypothetical protein